MTLEPLRVLPASVTGNSACLGRSVRKSPVGGKCQERHTPGSSLTDPVLTKPGLGPLQRGVGVDDNFSPCPRTQAAGHEGRTASISPALVPQGRSLQGGRPHLLGSGNALSHRTLIFSIMDRGLLGRDRKENTLSFLSAGRLHASKLTAGPGVPQMCRGTGPSSVATWRPGLTGVVRKVR